MTAAFGILRYTRSILRALRRAASRMERHFARLWKLRAGPLVAPDVMLPGESGVELLQFLRGNPATAEIPIIMATAKGMEYDKIQSLDLGADDYLVKPFGMMEMVSRIKAILRRYKPAQVQHLLKAGGLVINLDEYTVTADGERVTLTLKEFELLKLFLSHPGIAFTRDQLFNEIWGIDYMGRNPHCRCAYPYALRQKLGVYGSPHRNGARSRLPSGGTSMRKKKYFKQ